MSRRRLTRILAGATGVLVLVVGWLFLAPVQLGGSTAYALVVGNSMEPLLERGDLAVVRPRSEYREGDVVLYDSRELGAWVLHRVLRVEGDRYVFKGDNNDFVDPERVDRSRIVGGLTVTVPGIGGVAEWVRVPLHMALVVGLASLLALSGGAGVGIALRRRRRGPPVRRERRARTSLPGGDQTPLLVALGGACTVFALLAVVSFSRPATGAGDAAPAYVQHGALTYSARVTPSPVYPDGRVSSSQPVFLKLVPRLAVAFDYRLAAAQAQDVRGTLSLVGRLSDGAGWQRDFPIAARGFTGPRARVQGTLDLRDVRALLRRLEELTGTTQQVYTLALVPSVVVAGTVAGRTLSERFEPRVRFDLGAERLQRAEPRDSLVTARAVPGKRVVPATLSLGPLTPTVRTARWASLSGLAAALLLAALVVVGTLRCTGGDEAARIERRYGHLLVPVSAPGPAWGRATEIATIEGLARLAAQYEGVILHLATAGTHRYAVESGSTVFLYRSGDVSLMPPPYDEVPLFDESLEDVLAGRLVRAGDPSA